MAIFLPQELSPGTRNLWMNFHCRDQILNLVPGTLFYPPKNPCSKGQCFPKVEVFFGGGTEHFSLVNYSQHFYFSHFLFHLQLFLFCFFCYRRKHTIFMWHQCSCVVTCITAVAVLYVSGLICLIFTGKVVPGTKVSRYFRCKQGFIFKSS